MSSDRKREAHKRRAPGRRMPHSILLPDQSAFANCETGEKAALPSCEPNQWSVIVEMSDPVPVNSHEIEIIENYFADLIDDLLSAKAGK